MVTTFTVLQVAEHIERQVRDVWDSQFWIRGEVSGMKHHASGTVYLDLVQTDASGAIVARLPVSMPSSKARLVERRLRAVGQPLQNGLDVRVKANLEFWVRGGRLSLALADIDPSHTAGALAIARRALLEAMAADGSLLANGRVPVPRLPLTLGLVTSAGSQAFHDLTDELRASGHPFTILLAATLVQGPQAPGQLVRALSALEASGVDLILLTRGGGAEVDLMTFDHADVARAIASCGVPVWTGIGHHLDSPVAELVAAAGHKTPTALAQAVVSAVSAAAGDAERRFAAVCDRARRRLADADRELTAATRRLASARLGIRSAEGRLDGCASRLAPAAARGIAVHRRRIDQQHSRLGTAAASSVAAARRMVDEADVLVGLVDPERLLARGWSLTTDAGGHLVTGPVPVGTTLLTTTRGGLIRSSVTARTDPGEDPDA